MQLQDMEWVVVVGGIAAFLNSVTVGANQVAICWGPVLGAKAVKYRSAVLLGCICQLAGVLAFGPRTYTVYGGFLRSVFNLDAQPRLTLYAIMWTVITPMVWQFLAIRCRILVPSYLGTVASTLGAALVFPGASLIDFGHSQKAPPFLSGVGPVILAWFWALLLSSVLVTSTFLFVRSLVFRGEDAFHKALWMMPGAGCITGGVVAFLVMRAIGPPVRCSVTDRYNLKAQGVILFIVTAGSVGCLATCLLIPRLTRRVSSRGRAVKVLKRMNLLGLDDATVESLSAQDKHGEKHGWAQRMYSWLFEGDLFAGVASDPKLMRIHSTAEEFDRAAEETLVPFQAIVCMCLAAAHGANNARTSVGMLAIMLAVHNTGAVAETVELPWAWRIMAAVGMTLGTLLLGFRLTPVSGVLLAKMTPFRSCSVVLTTALTICVLGELQIKGGVLTYAVVAAVPTVGFTEGSSHLNWRVCMNHLVWWFLGFFAVMGATYALVAQGVYSPSIVSTQATQA